jgi:hypothetical protein
VRLAPLITVLLAAPPARAEVIETTRAANVYRTAAKRERDVRGRVDKGARFEVVEQRRGAGCGGAWLRIDERAWLCSRDTRATDDEPGAPELPALAGDDIVPHTYVLTQDARVYPTLDDAADGANEDTIPGLGGFRVRAVERRGGRGFVRVSEGWVPREDVRYAQPSAFRGVALAADDRGRRHAFVRAADGARVRDEQGRPLPVDPIERFTFLRDVGEPVAAGGHTLIPIGDGRSVRADDVGLIRHAAPPDEVAGTGERWLDVDLEQQTLVAYEGETPVRATLVSTARTATPEGVFRIGRKRATSFMKSRPEHRNKYNLDTPWVMTLQGRIAMHAVYWHEDFGTARSHGCVNLAPQDAKWVWDWSEPAVPDGWLRVDAAEEGGGTIVRIRREGRARSAR